MPETYWQGSREAPYLEDWRRKMLQGAFDVTQVPGTVTPQGIAGLQPFQTGAATQFAGMMGIDPTTGLPTGTGAQYDPAFASAQQAIAAGQATTGAGIATTGMGIPALQSATQQYDPSTSNYSDFFNQYQGDVTQEALKQMDAQAATARKRTADTAQQAGAFGGSRFGVESAELDKNLQDIKSRRIFQDLAQNFEQAQQKAIGTSESARARQLQGAGIFGQLGAQAGQLGAQQAQMGQMGAGLAQQQFGMGQAGLGNLFQFGAGQQAQQQSTLNEQYRMAEAKRQEPYGRLSYFGDIMSGVPSVSQTLTQKPLPYTNPMLGAMGMGLGAYGILSGEGSGGAFGMFGGG
jgi:hypothetical protein